MIYSRLPSRHLQTFRSALATALVTLLFSVVAIVFNMPAAHASVTQCRGQAVVRCMTLTGSGGWYWATAAIIDSGSDSVNYAVGISRVGDTADYDGWYGFHDVSDTAESWPKGCVMGQYLARVEASFSWVGPGGGVASETWGLSDALC
jgi:hypothetical protein